MWTPRQLDEATAAIRLGDVVLPPVGVVLEWLPWSGEGLTRVGSVVGVELADTFDTPCGHVLRVEERGRGLWRVDPQRVVRVVHVPHYVPAFHLWKRPTPQEDE